ncbi:MAG TPA: site-2 protease family protein [Gammaproteobacteria bacterium]|nr:site-2 protease family protein [Gammaproteobacteria bacterium]
MEELNLIQRIVVWSLPVLFAITVHEVAHGWMALKLGDRTAMMLGRLTLNPVRHVDPVGTLLVPALMLAVGGFVFGWARPVPVTWENLRHPRRDMALVALAGPLANLVMLLLWTAVFKLGLLLAESHSALWATRPLIFMGMAGIYINIILMALNLLPLPPLDGSRVVSGLLPGRLAWQYNRIEPFGLPILLLLMFTGILGKLLWPVIWALLLAVSAASAVPLGLFNNILQSII